MVLTDKIYKQPRRKHFTSSAMWFKWLAGKKRRKEFHTVRKVTWMEMGCEKDKKNNPIPEAKYHDRVSDVNMANRRSNTPSGQNQYNDVIEKIIQMEQSGFVSLVLLARDVNCAKNSSPAP